MNFDLHRINGLWLFVLGTGLVAAALLTYILLLEGIMGTFSIQQARPALLVAEQGAAGEARVALLNSDYTRRAYAVNNPQDPEAAWVDRALNSWNSLLLDQNVVGYTQIGDAELEEGDIAGFDLLILPSTLALSDRQIEVVKGYMDQGGSVWASWQPGIFDEEGGWRGWTFVEEAFGVTYMSEVGRTNSNFQVYADTFPGYTPPGMYLPERLTADGVRVDGAADDSLSARVADLPTSLRDERRREAQISGFAPLRDYLWMDTTTTRLPRTDFAIADTMRVPIRDLDGDVRVRDAVAVTYYTWNGYANEAPRVPYPSTSAGIRRMTLRAGTPITGGIPAGYRAKVQVFTPAVALEVSGERAKPFAFWYDFATEDLNVTEALRSSTAGVYGTYGSSGGRFVYMGFQRDAIFIDRQDVEDQEAFSQLFANLLNYLLREPVTWTHDWPARPAGLPYDAAALISVVDDADEPSGMQSVAQLLGQNGIGGSYFVRPNTSAPNDLLRSLDQQGDVGVYGDFRRNLDGSTLAQTRALEEMRNRLESRVGGRVTGYRPSTAGILDTTTLRALTLADYGYFLPDSIGRRLAPKVMGTPNERLVRMGYTSRSDRDIDVRSISAGPLTQDVTRAAYEGSFYRLVLHTDGLATPGGLPVVSQILRALRDQDFWIAPGDEIAHWWRLRRNVSVATAQPGPNRINVEISNLNNDVIRDLAISLVPGHPVTDASSVSVRSEIVELSEEFGVRERTGVRVLVAPDGATITLVLNQMRPQQTAVLQINLCAGEDECVARLALVD
jgi:hypothetical protein